MGWYKKITAVKGLIIFIMLILPAGSFVFAYEPAQSRTRQTRSTRAQSLQEKTQQLQQESREAENDVSEKYDSILGYVNSAATPTKEEISETRKSILKNRRYLALFSERRRCDYHIMAAWTYYFDGKETKCLPQAESAQKVIANDKNAVATRFALGVLYEKYDLTIEALTQASAVEILKAQKESEKPELDVDILFGQQEQKESDVQSYRRSENDLMLDPNKIRIDLLGKTFDANLESIGDKALPEDQPENIRCVLLWKIAQDEIDEYRPFDVNDANDPNDPNLPREAKDQALLLEKPVELEIFESAAPRYSKSEREKLPEVEAFAKMFSRMSKVEMIKFFAVNLNASEDRESLENWLKHNRQDWPVAVMKEENGSAYADYFQNADQPVMIILAGDGLIKYAGTVSGFLPEMVIKKLFMMPIVFESPAESPRQTEAEPLPQEPATLEPAESEAVSGRAEKIAMPQTPEIKTHDPDYFDPQAEKLLENAKAFLKIGNVMVQSHTYRKPIDMCRRVIRDYPGTKYEDQAREILRRVPERFHKRYGLTDEELGL